MAASNLPSEIAVAASVRDYLELMNLPNVSTNNSILLGLRFLFFVLFLICFLLGYLDTKVVLSSKVYH